MQLMLYLLLQILSAKLYYNYLIDTLFVNFNTLFCNQISNLVLFGSISQ